MTDRSEAVDRLVEIRDEIEELVREAAAIATDHEQGNQAHSYWLPHIVGALHDDHEWLGGSMTTMQDTIDALTPEPENLHCVACWYARGEKVAVADVERDEDRNWAGYCPTHDDVVDTIEL